MHNAISDSARVVRPAVFQCESRMHNFSWQSARTVRWLLIGLLLVGFAVRLVWFLPFPNISAKADQAVFFSQARAVWQRGFAAWKYDERAPGYILFLAANLYLTNSDSRTVVRVTQSLLGVATIAVVYTLTRFSFVTLNKRRREQVAVVAAALVALSPEYVIFGQFLWSETFFVFVTTLGLAFLLRGYRSRGDWRWFSASGVAFAGALLTREVLLAFVLFFLPLWVWLALPLVRRQRVLMLAAVIAGISVLMIPWVGRNVMQGNGLELISWQGGRDFWRFNARLVQRGWRDSQLAVLEALPTGQDKNALAYSEGARLIALNPVKWILAKSYNTAGLWRTIHSVGLSTARRLELISRTAQKSVKIYFDAFGVFCVLFTIIGFVYSREARVTLLFAFFLFAAVLAFFLIHYIVRFRIGLDAPLFPLTAHGIFTSVAGLWSSIRTRQIADWRRLGVAGFLIVLMGATYPNLLLSQLR